MTVLEVIQKSGEFLERKGVDSPRLQIELLLEHVLKLPRLQLYLNFERPITDKELDRLRECVKRRGAREPLQHIVGSTSFCGFEIEAGPQALIPRPETELLAERAWTFLNAQSSESDPSATVLELGVGSGCLSVAIAMNCPSARVTAIDCSDEALELARENVGRHGLGDRVQALKSDAFQELPPGLQYDLIVSNPPYIPRAEIEALEPEVRDHDPRAALDGGEDGLDFYRLMSEQAATWLKPGGALMLEFGDGQAPRIEGIFRDEGWAVDAIERDLADKERFIIVSLQRT